MTYTVPPKKPDPKQRFVRVTDPDEIRAIERNCLDSPIGAFMDGAWWAEAHSLAQFRKQHVTFDV